MAALLALILTPATLAVVLDINGKGTDFPSWLFLPGSAALWVSAVILWRQTGIGLPTNPFTRRHDARDSVLASPG
jgi:hypothetical protein